MATAKEAAIAMIQKMPEEITWEELAIRVYTRSRIEMGLADVAAGRVTSHEAYMVESQQWLESPGRRSQSAITAPSTN